MARDVKPATKNRRDVGEVVFLSEQMAAARELSSCCVGVEASLTSRVDYGEILKRFAGKLGSSS
ncbi:MAG: hypothetical protein Kilf2KO_11360 [Rhodospirillales bacterium]